jgi:hypothetical protein
MGTVAAEDEAAGGNVVEQMNSVVVEVSVSVTVTGRNP